MRVAIIGAGNVGRALGSSLVRAGHTVVYASKSGDTARQAAAAIGAHSAASAAEAARQAEVIVLAVPSSAAEAVSREIGPAAAGRPVVDATNVLKPGLDGLDHANGKNGAQRIQGWLRDSPVVKAFNTLFAANLADPVRDGIPLDAFVAGDDPAAKQRVTELAASAGFNPIDVGGLDAATALEYMAYLNIALNATHGWSWTTGWKLVGAPARAGS